MSGTVPWEDYAAALAGQDAAEYRADRAEAEANKLEGEVQHLDDANATLRKQADALADALGLVDCCGAIDGDETVAECANAPGRPACQRARALADYRKGERL